MSQSAVTCRSKIAPGPGPGGTKWLSRAGHPDQWQFHLPVECRVAKPATPCVAWLGKVVGTVTISSNSGLTSSDASLVTIGGNLICQSNTPGMTLVHGPSLVDGTAQGQCTAALRRRARRSATDRLRQRHRAQRLRPCRLRASRCRTRLSPRRWIRPLAGVSPSVASSTDMSISMSARLILVRIKMVSRYSCLSRLPGMAAS